MEGAFDVITIGTATQDIFYPLASDGFKFEKGAKTEVGAPFCSVGGGAVNAAVTFARQGFKTAALFRIGADSAGERTVLAHRGAADSMPLKEIPFAKLAAKWVYIAPANIAVPVIEAIVDHCYAQGILVALNPSVAYCADRGALLRPLLSKIKVLLTNREEAGMISGGVFADLDELVDGICVMTDGPQGVRVSDGNRIYTAGIFPDKNLVSRTGAGDAFGSGFVAGLIRKEDIAYAMRLASANATAVTEHLGAHNGALTHTQFAKEARWKTLDIA